jgi:hypothetical protein
MSFEDDSLDSLKSIVRTAFKYGVNSGLQPNILDLERIKKSYLAKGLISDAEEIDFIINFLKREKELVEAEHRKLVAKTRDLSQKIPLGLVVSFRYFDETLSGELRGYLADRVLVIARYRGSSKLFEVSPFDIKV